jgi:hypothetical protein
LFQGRGNSVEEVLVAEGLGQKVDGTGYHGAHRHWNISVAGEEDDRRVTFHLCQRFLDFLTDSKSYLRAARNEESSSITKTIDPSLVGPSFMAAS